MKLCALSLLAAALLVPARAQSMIAARAGLVSYTEGEVYLNEKPVGLSAVAPPAMRDDGRLRSGDGRAEVLLNPCVVLHLDQFSLLRMVASQLSDTRVELLAGSAIVQADGGIRDAKVTVLLPGVAVPLSHEGLYRFAAEPPRLKVFAGKALDLGPGRMFSLAGGTRTTQRFNPKDTDSFDWWSERRMVDFARANGMANRQAIERQQAAAARDRAASIEAQTHDPHSSTYDPARPTLPSSPAPYPPINSGPARPRVCLASGR